jgi:hypothetical protein
MKKILTFLSLTFVGFLPITTLAFEDQSLKSLIDSLVRIANSLVPLIFAIAGIVFIWGVVRFIRHANEPKARDEGRNFMIYSIIALAVMMSVWGLALLLKNAIFPNATGPLNLGSTSGAGDTKEEAPNDSGFSGF